MTSRRYRTLLSDSALWTCRGRCGGWPAGAGGRRPLWRDNRAFFHRGTDGQWRGLLGPDDLARYHERLAELAAPDLVDWLHGGWLGSRVADEITGGRP